MGLKQRIELRSYKFKATNLAPILTCSYTDKNLGGGGGCRTRVRKSSAVGTTCLVAL